MPDWLYDLTISQVMLFMIVVFVGGTWLGAMLLRPILRLFALKQPEWNGLVSAVLSCFGIFYGLLLGLLTVAAYQNQSRVDDLVSGEALMIAGVYGELVDVYPKEFASELQADLKEYCQVTIETDWPLQQKGTIPMAGSAAMRKFLHRLRTFEPKTGRETNLHQLVIGQVEKFRDLRRARVNSVKVGLPGSLWYVVVIGAVINICFIYLFDLRFLNVLLLGGMLSFFIATVIGLILVMDRPLRGPNSITAENFVTLYEIVMQRPTK